MIREIEGLGQETHEDLYELQDHWQKEAYKVNPRSPKTGKRLVTWNQVSPSQIENYVKCKRSWFFKSVQRIQEPQKGHQALGTSFHLIMEKVPKGLTWPSRQDTNATEEEWDKANQMANVALPLLPLDPQGLTKREHGIILETYENGPILRGYIDLAIPPGVGWPAFLIPASEAIIGDYKTLSDFRYMKTPEELASSIQMMSYAKWAISDWPTGLVGPMDPMPEHVRLLHIYAKTRSPYNRSSIRNESAVVTIPEINAFWDKTLDIVREMQSTSSCSDFNDVEANGALTGHCEAYGGCHYRDKCGLSKETGLKSLFQIGKKPATTPTSTGDIVMSGSAVLAKILAARAAASGTTPAISEQTQVDQGQASPTPAPEAATPSTPVQTQPKANGPISGLLAKIESTGHGKPVLTGSVAQQLNKETGANLATYPGEGMRAQTTIASVGELMKYASGIIPPDAPPRTQPVITTPGTPVADPEAEPAATEEGDDEEVSTPSNDAVSSQPATPGVGSNLPAPSGSDPGATPGQVEGKKRGRPSKEEMQAREAAAQAEFNAKVETEVAKRLANGGSVVQGSNSQASADLLSELSIRESELQGAKQALAAAQQTIHNLRNQSGSANSGRSDQGLTIYVDCMPTKGQGELTDFHEWIRPATQAVEESNNVADWRLINYVGKGLLAAQIRELIKLQGLPQNMMIPSFAAGADIALEILSPQAKKIIRPLR